MEQNLSLLICLKYFLWWCWLACSLIVECVLIVYYVCGKLGSVVLECWMCLKYCTLCCWVTYWDVPLHALMLHLLGWPWITIRKMLVWALLCQWCLNELQCTSVWNVLRNSHLPGGWICYLISWLSAVLQNLCLVFCWKQHEEFIDIYN
jgi:hypothetical protein